MVGTSCVFDTAIYWTNLTQLHNTASTSGKHFVWPEVKF